MSALSPVQSSCELTKYETLLPVITSSHIVEEALIFKLNKSLFSMGGTSKGQTLPVYTKPQIALPSPSPSPLSSPPRSLATPVLTKVRNGPDKPVNQHLAEFPITPPPSTPSPVSTVRTGNEIMTIASKIPLFRKRKTNYVNMEATMKREPVILKLCNVSYPDSFKGAVDNSVAFTASRGKGTPHMSTQQFLNHNDVYHRCTTEIISSKHRKFQCKTCSMAFTTSGHLSRHNKIHTGEKNYVCPHESCGQRFSRHDNCIQHYRTHLKKKQRQAKKGKVAKK
ncbi:C2H2-type zinc finger protein KNAG_0J00870 [Huiozyma naganishii CBS 8797]|uniref:C2H2-type domain-containing protein n=1 Tax=Huiozyma naganishii (strain ATCC MYA-139 / BCRC 22969 / CBS 8797 / KCTC 17520 / NBRC 10181 / NCYC 3082 / Yp74L-3) TaxID=1071383 RepID=J7S9L0_HUIN7|nr:hypothetical protein KNAG_0J00870 [Kazachstania naganishii CBS 8797]CCK72169.1 hypothetical protein KNAG_0J00870 [Kazachstania naganishii CBS 8797]